MIKLFEEWADGATSFVRISSSVFDDNDSSVPLREVDKKRIKLIFKGWEFKEDPGHSIHYSNVKWTDCVYLLQTKHHKFLFWKDEAEYFYVLHRYHLPFQFPDFATYKCDLLDGLEDLKNHIESVKN